MQEILSDHLQSARTQQEPTLLDHGCLSCTRWGGGGVLNQLRVDSPPVFQAAPAGMCGRSRRAEPPPPVPEMGRGKPSATGLHGRARSTQVSSLLFRDEPLSGGQCWAAFGSRSETEGGRGKHECCRSLLNKPKSTYPKHSQNGREDFSVRLFPGS